MRFAQSLLVLFLNGKQFWHCPRTKEILCFSFRSGIHVTMAGHTVWDMKKYRGKLFWAQDSEHLPSDLLSPHSNPGLAKYACKLSTVRPENGQSPKLICGARHLPISELPVD